MLRLFFLSQNLTGQKHFNHNLRCEHDPRNPGGPLKALPKSLFVEISQPHMGVSTRSTSNALIGQKHWKPTHINILIPLQFNKYYQLIMKLQFDQLQSNCNESILSYGLFTPYSQGYSLFIKLLPDYNIKGRYNPIQLIQNKTFEITSNPPTKP